MRVKAQNISWLNTIKRFSVPVRCDKVSLLIVTDGCDREPHFKQEETMTKGESLCFKQHIISNRHKLGSDQAHYAQLLVCTFRMKSQLDYVGYL